MKKHKTKFNKLFKVFLIIVLLVTISASSFFFTIYFSVKLNKDTVVAQKSNIQIYSAVNQEIDNTAISRYTNYDDISINIINAFIALEDKRFLEHNGFDYYRTIGAMVNNIKAGYMKEGGSTITQQLAKNTQLTSEKTYIRKIKEIKLARDIEEQYSKKEIIEMYLNAIYFGNGIYGIGSASWHYFNKDSSEITIAEGAYLAGIVKNPTKYSPTNNIDDATERKNLVLSLMLEQGYISQDEYETESEYVYQKPIDENYDLVSPYYQNTIVEGSKLLGISEKDIMLGGYKIYTYYDENSQNTLYTAFNSKEYEILNDEKSPASYATMLSDNNNGGITAYYSNFNNSIYNFSRQPASTIKPILVYSSAIESGYVNPSTPVLDEKIDFNGYNPSNYANYYMGWTDVQTALQKSSNVVSVDILNEVGIEYSKSIASKMGIPFSSNDNGLSLALGGMENGVNFSELSSAYMCLANMGKYTKNTFIRAIYDENNRLIYKNDEDFTQVLSPESAYLVTDMLCGTVQNGTARKLSELDLTIAGKTGTNSYPNSQKNLDSWCISYTPDVTLCAWYGDLDNSEVNAVNTTGGNYPALISRYIYSSLDMKKTEFAVPPGIISLDIDKYALENDHELFLANMFTPFDSIESSYFNEKYAPIEYSPYFDFQNFDFICESKNDLISDEKIVNISLNIVKPYETRLFRQNYLTGETVELQLIDENNGNITISDIAEDYAVYNYYIEFYYGDKKLAYSPSETVFT
jgi:penicillin-binding protein 2A